MLVFVLETGNRLTRKHRNKVISKGHEILQRSFSGASGQNRAVMPCSHVWCCNSCHVCLRASYLHPAHTEGSVRP